MDENLWSMILLFLMTAAATEGIRNSINMHNITDLLSDKNRAESFTVSFPPASFLLFIPEMDTSAITGREKS